MKLLQGVRIFADEQQKLGEDSVLFKMRPKDVKRSA
jgi:hypothetical protein